MEASSVKIKDHNSAYIVSQVVKALLCFCVLKCLNAIFKTEKQNDSLRLERRILPISFSGSEKMLMLLCAQMSKGRNT